MNKNELKEAVLIENEKTHDYCAKNHTRSVPYQCRKITRNYIWQLISEQLRKNKIKVMLISS